MGAMNQNNQPPSYAGEKSSDAVASKGVGSKKNAAAGRTAPMATIHDDDERLLAQIGYRQVRSKLIYLLMSSKFQREVFFSHSCACIGTET
jgi:hypothetical protein